MDREPSVLKGDGTVEPPAAGVPPVERAPAERPTPPRREVRPRAPEGDTVLVSGFWRRLAAALVDAVIVVPVATLLALIAGKLADLSLPPARHAGVDYWLDLWLAGDPALWGGLGLVAAIGVLYLFLFQATAGRTPGMRLLRLRIIDVYGQHPSLWRAGLRTAGYLLSIATLGLGFLWVGFDREKRGLHDWLAGTYVIRSAGGARP